MFLSPLNNKGKKIQPEMTAKALHTCSVFVGHAAMETQGAHPGSETSSMRGHGVVLQLLHGLVRPQRMHACSAARGWGPPALHKGTACHKSTSSSPAGSGSGPWRLSSLPCFLLTEQKTGVSTGAMPAQPRTSSVSMCPHHLERYSLNLFF